MSSPRALHAPLLFLSCTACVHCFVQLPAGYLSTPKAIPFDTLLPDKTPATAHMIYYPPTNKWVQGSIKPLAEPPKPHGLRVHN